MGISSGLITNDNITSSSHVGTGNEPWMSRLSVGPDADAWCAAPADTTPYLQIDLGRVVVISQIAVAGRGGQGIVTTFKLSSSEDGAFWRTYKKGSIEEVMENLSYIFIFNYSS